MRWCVEAATEKEVDGVRTLDLRISIKCFEFKFEFGRMIWLPILYFMIEIHDIKDGSSEILQIALIVQPLFHLYSIMVDEKVVWF